MSHIDSAAFASIDSNGLTAREYAAIQLRVPNSGTDWLDQMIDKSRRLDIATALATPGRNAAAVIELTDRLIAEFKRPQ